MDCLWKQRVLFFFTQSDFSDKGDWHGALLHHSYSSSLTACWERETGFERSLRHCVKKSPRVLSNAEPSTQQTWKETVLRSSSWEILQSDIFSFRLGSAFGLTLEKQSYWEPSRARSATTSVLMCVPREGRARWSAALHYNNAPLKESSYLYCTTAFPISTFS